MSGREGRAGADVEVAEVGDVVEAVEGDTAALVPPAPARSQGFGGDGLDIPVFLCGLAKAAHSVVRVVRNSECHRAIVTNAVDLGEDGRFVELESWES